MTGVRSRRDLRAMARRVPMHARGQTPGGGKSSGAARPDRGGTEALSAAK